jgi:hypothetical protein
METRLVVVTTFLLVAVSGLGATTLVKTSLPEKRDKSSRPADANPAPELRLINDLDKVMQERFITAQTRGMRRIGPQPNPHMEYFEPRTEEEIQAVNNLQNGQWKVGVYLFGRRAYQKPPKKDGDAKRGLLVQYRLNRPVLVTNNLKQKELASPGKLRDGLDEAFAKFKESDSHNFSLGKWSYVAKPVRARESCLKCHTDLFAAKLGERKYAYRSRRVGDPIGVLVYAFGKKN